MLVDFAKNLEFREFVRAVAYWLQRADPDGEDQKADDALSGRKLHLSQSVDGVWFLNGVLDPISGEIVSRQLARIEDALFQLDWAEATERLGREPTLEELERTPAQRRADALVEMAVRSAIAPRDGKRPEPSFSVLVGYETFHGRICELSSGRVIPPGSLVPWLDEATIERAVFDGPSRIIDIGTRRRLFKGATRRAVEIRDRECFQTYCDVGSDRCQADHVVPYAAGGLTTQDNGRMACGFHNRLRHKPPPGS